jgi:cytochrome bd-type quinol oxidase subunit 2
LAQRRAFSATEVGIATIFLFLLLGSLWGMTRTVRKISRYNRDIYPKLHWNWAHTYMCRRCGKSSLIPS